MSERRARVDLDALAELSITAAARLLGIGEYRVSQAVHDGRLPSKRTPRGGYLVLRSDLDAFAATLAARSIGVPAETGWQPAPIPLVEESLRAADEIDALCPLPRPSGYVYAIRPAAGGLTKIGMTVDIAERMMSIQNMNPGPIVLVGIAHDGEFERILHRKFIKNRRHGEWFDLGDQNPLKISKGGCFTCCKEAP